MRLLAALLLMLVPAAEAAPRRILFVGNSFTQGYASPVMRYRTDAVTDLTGQRIGGVPALFRTFAEEAGQDWTVFSETQGGETLRFHLERRSASIDRAWDAVVLQEYSTMGRERPGDPTEYRRAARALAAMFTRANPAVRVELMATWSRADLAYRPGSPWSGKPIATMAGDLANAARAIDAASPEIDGVLPVGEAWNRAVAAGVADANPYDGIAYGQADLWAYDHYHASAAGYYLEALVVFGRIAGVDPRMLGRDERAAGDLGLSPDLAVALQRVAAETLAATQ
jgi:hypothetical protein